MFNHEFPYPTCASYEGADEVRTEGEESQGSASSTETGEGQTTMTANDEDNHYNVRSSVDHKSTSSPEGTTNTSRNRRVLSETIAGLITSIVSLCV